MLKYNWIVFDCRVSGCTDHFAPTEADAFEMGRDVVATFNMPEVIAPEGYDEPMYDPADLVGLIPYQDQHKMDPYQVTVHTMINTL